MCLQGSLGAEYSGAVALKIDPEIGTVNAAGVSHVAATDAHTPGAYAWQEDFTAATGLSGRKAMDRGLSIALSNSKFCEAAVVHIDGDGAGNPPAGSTGTGTTYSATQLIDTGRTQWASAYWAKQHIYTSDGKDAWASPVNATTLNVFTTKALSVAGWNGGTPAAGSTYKIVLGESVYLWSLFDNSAQEQASIRLADDGAGNLVLQAWFSTTTNVPVQQGANQAVVYDTDFLVGWYVSVVAAAGAIVVWYSTTTSEPANWDTVRIVNVTGLTSPATGASSLYAGHNATKGNYVLCKMHFDDVAGFDDLTNNDSAWNVVADATFIHRWFVSKYGVAIADGPTLQWAIGAGGDGTTHYSCINDVTTAMPDNDTSYVKAVQSAAGNLDDMFTMTTCANMGVDSDNIHGCALHPWADETVGTQNEAPLVNKGGVTAFPDDSSTTAFGATYKWGSGSLASPNFTFNKDTANAQWTRANIDSSYWGIEARWVATASAEARMSALILKVVFWRAAPAAGTPRSWAMII